MACDVEKVVKEALRFGDGRSPKPGEWAKVHYTCKLAGTDEVLDSSYDRGKPFCFTLGQGEVIPGLDEGVSLMHCGELARLTVQPDLAFGVAGRASGVIPAGPQHTSASSVESGSQPPGCLEFELELLEVGQAPSGPEEDLSPEERLQRAMRAKDAGNGFFRAGELERAAQSYTEGVALLGHVTPGAPGSLGTQGDDQVGSAEGDEVAWLDSARREAREKLLLSCCLNLAQCELKLGAFTEATSHATTALALDPSSSKAFYRRGLAALGTGLLDEAKADLTRAARLEPKNAEVRAQLQACQERIQDADRKDRGTFGGLFDRGAIYGGKVDDSGLTAAAPGTASLSQSTES